MGFISIISLFLCLVPFGMSSSVLDFGAVGDGKTDDSQAFLKAWQTICESTEVGPTLIIPAGKTFFLSPVSFAGPCKSANIHVSLLGNLVAPVISSWPKTADVNKWLKFAAVSGLTINGRGQINGRGETWWNCGGKIPSDKLDGCKRPSALKFDYCTGLKLSDITSINSPSNHISINECKGVTVTNVHLTAPGYSKNTDGIDISKSKNIVIQDSFIATGDDCVAINSGSSFINITHTACGPGHGISVGSLGENGENSIVEEIHVKNCNFTRTTNGVRIKTWPSGTGYAKKLTFEQIGFVNVNNAIIIDQYYCQNSNCSNEGKNSAIQISDVTYIGVHGTSVNSIAITLNCSATVPCNNIVMNNVNIKTTTGIPTTAVCNNAHGTESLTDPTVPCLRKQFRSISRALTVSTSLLQSSATPHSQITVESQNKLKKKMEGEMKKEMRYAVVTGANKGIGLEIARRLAEEESVVVVLTARDEKRGLDATSSLNTRLHSSSNDNKINKVFFHQLDVRDPKSAQALADFIHTQFGKLDILVNNAGASGVVVDEEGLKALNIDPIAWLSGKATNTVQGVIQQTYEKAEECLDTNYYGCKRVTEALLPLLKLSDSGARIVNVSSLRSELKRMPNEQTRKELNNISTLTEDKVDGLVKKFLHDLKQGKLEENRWPMMLPAYSVSKTMLNAYTRILAKKYPDMCINCVHPGYVNTDINWHTGTMAVEEGAGGPVMLALLPTGGPSGHYFDQTEMAEF